MAKVKKMKYNYNKNSSNKSPKLEKFFARFTVSLKWQKDEVDRMCEGLSRSAITIDEL